MENTEPQGIKDLREAKANYLDALANLRAADAEKVKAEATLVQAQAATEQARATWVQAKAKAQEIENQFVSDTNAIYLAKAQADAEVAIKKAEAELVKAEQKLAEAEESLRAYLVRIEEQSKQLTWAERQIVWAYTWAYNNVIDKQKDVRYADSVLYAKTYTDKGVQSVEAAKAEYENQIARAEKGKAFFEAAIAAHEELTEEQIANYEEWVEKYDALQAEIAGFEYDKAQIAKDSALNEIEYKAALDSFYDAMAAKQTAIKKATKSFKLEFTGDKALALPELKVKGTNVVKNFADAVNAITVSEGWIKVNEELDTLGIKFGSTHQKVAGKVVDTLNIIIDALKREQVVVDQLVKDTAGIAALVVDTKHVYDSIKTILVDGVDKYPGIAKAKKAADEKKADKVKAQTKFTTDSTELIASIKNFIKVWNEYSGNYSLVRKNDSLNVWTAFMRVVDAREAIFDAPKNKKDYFTYYTQKYGEVGNTTVDTVSVKFSDLDFAKIRTKAVDGESRAVYGGKYDEVADEVVYEDAFKNVLIQAGFPEAFIETVYVAQTDGTVKLSELDSATVRSNTNKYATLFYNTYRFAQDNKNVLWWNEGTGAGGAYVPSALTKAIDDSEKADEAITTARQKYYEDVYCTFWGIEYNADFKAKLNENQTAFKPSATDSLKIVYTEKTFTEPTVLAKFEGATGFFTPAEGKNPAHIDFKTKVTLKDSKALDVIKAQFGGIDYLKPEGGLTLYAQYLATAQFASDAKNYKENTAALKELETVVATVKTAYDAAVAATTSGSALRDSLITKLVGKKSIKDVKPTDSVSVVSKNITGFITKDGKGTFNLAGEQKTLAEKYLTDYAKTWSELEKQKADIKATVENNNKLADVYADYVKALYEIEEGVDPDNAPNPDEIYKAIKTKFDGVNALIKLWIKGCEEQVALAEGSIKQLEAGYSAEQLAIENAEGELAKARKALEQAELEFAVAEEAYKAVLAAHGITE